MASFARLGLATGALFVLAGSTGSSSRPDRLPPIVFVSRAPLPGHAGVPGLGPAARAAATGGRLLRRDPDGAVRPLLPAAALFDVSDPSVSFDGRWIAFAGTPHADSGWRIYRVPAAGGAPVAVTTDRGPEDARRFDAPASVAGVDRARFDDLDPCWVGEDRLCFASTRGGGLAEYADVPVTNLWMVRADGSGLARLTAERNGAEEPAWDPEARRIVYARWWFNRHRPDRALGLTTDATRALPQDSVNLWQAVEVTERGTGLKLAAGAIGSRLGTMAYQPARLADGTWCGVFARNTGLFPATAALGVQIFPGRYGTSRRILGALLDDQDRGGYGDPRGLAAPSACSPAGLPDGRVLMAFDPGARGDWGVVVADRNGDGWTKVVDFPGTLELDPAPILPLASRSLAHATQAPDVDDADDAESDRGARHEQTFTFECRNVFAQGDVDGPVPGAPRLERDLVLRFFALAPSGSAGHDTALVIRDVPVARDGSVRAAGLPADTPMFEELLGPGGRVVLAGHGPAHVAGLNWAPPGSTARCVGCHLGHSTLPAGPARDASAATWFNVAPSAHASATSVLPGTVGAAGAIDRRTRGDARATAWIADGARDVALRLGFDETLEMRELVLYAPRRDPKRGTDVRIGPCSVRLTSRGTPVATLSLATIGPDGTRLPLHGELADAIEVRIDGARGRIVDRPVAGLAEVTAIARVPLAGW